MHVWTIFHSHLLFAWESPTLLASFTVFFDSHRKTLLSDAVLACVCCQAQLFEPYACLRHLRLFLRGYMWDVHVV